MRSFSNLYGNCRHRVAAQTPDFWRLGGRVLGFAAGVVMVWPEIGIGDASNTRLTGVFLAFSPAVLTALALFMIRNPNQTESPGAIALYFVLVSMVGALVTLSSEWLVPSGWTLALLIGSGLFGGFAHIALTILFLYAKATRLAPLEYIGLL